MCSSRSISHCEVLDAEMYRLSSVLSSHTSDVRSLASTSDNRMASGSRDGSVKVWRLEEESNTWQVELELSNLHNGKYVTSVAIRSSEEIVTGAQDGHLRLFSHTKLKCDVEKAHDDAIVSLFISETGTIVSGSWDKLVKVWVGDLKCVMTLKGHEAAVWDVVLINKLGLIVSASADNSIKVWKAGAIKETVSVHSQAVRGLSYIGNKLVSCSNDGKVVLFDVDDTNVENDEYRKLKVVNEVKVFDGFLYSIKGIDSETLATAGETSGIRIISQIHGEQQVLQVPALSVWSLCVLNNGDVAAGCSDGHIWIFSKHPQRHANAETKALYDELLSKMALPAATTLEGLNADDLPGPSALLAPGKRDGQTVLIKDGANITVHSWSEAEGRWAKVGDVVGTPGDDGRPKGSAPDGGKVHFEGKEYDFVFDVDIEDGVILKLPYNKSQEPYHAAQEFIHKHQLPQAYLDTVANFIFKNSGQTPSVQQYGGACDPFTGANAYSTTPSDNTSTAMDVDASCSFFPRTDFVSFTQRPKVDAVKVKLVEFNALQDESDRIDDKLFDGMVALTAEDHNPTMDEICGVLRALRWTAEMAFPALDILRLAVIDPRISVLIFKDDKEKAIADTLISLLFKFLTPSAPPKCQMLALRTLTNLFSVPEGLEAVLAVRDSMVRRMAEVLPSENKHVQIAVSSLLLNLSVVSVNNNDVVAQSQCLLTIGCLGLDATDDPEAKFRLLVALGTLLNNSKENRTNAKELMMSEKLDAFKNDEVNKVATCARAISNLL